MPPCVCGTLTASVLSASSPCSGRLVRSLGNLHVAAAERDPVFCERRGSRRDKDSGATNTGALNNLNMAQLQASSPLTRSEPFGGCACVELVGLSCFCRQVSSTLEKLHLNVCLGVFFTLSLVWSGSVGMNPILPKSRPSTHFFSLLTLTTVPSEPSSFGLVLQLGWSELLIVKTNSFRKNCSFFGNDQILKH